MGFSAALVADITVAEGKLKSIKTSAPLMALSHTSHRDAVIGNAGQPAGILATARLRFQRAGEDCSHVGHDADNRQSHLPPAPSMAILSMLTSLTLKHLVL